MTASRNTGPGWASVPPMTSDRTFKVVTRMHRIVFDLTKGRAGGKVAGMAVVKLTTIGRKSGLPRVTMLTSPVHDESRVVIVASKGGAEKHPVWYLNLCDNPEVTITMQGKTRPMVARTANAEEKAKLWPKVVAGYKGYRGYQTKTDRDIPVVILQAAGA